MNILMIACFIAGQVSMTGAMYWNTPSGITIQESIASGDFSCKDVGVKGQLALVDAPDSAMECYPMALDPPIGRKVHPKKGASMWLSPVRWQHFVKLQCADDEKGQTLLALKTR